MNVDCLLHIAEFCEPEEIIALSQLDYLTHNVFQSIVSRQLYRVVREYIDSKRYNILWHRMLYNGITYQYCRGNIRDSIDKSKLFVESNNATMIKKQIVLYELIDIREIADSKPKPHRQFAPMCLKPSYVKRFEFICEYDN